MTNANWRQRNDLANVSRVGDTASVLDRASDGIELSRSVLAAMRASARDRERMRPKGATVRDFFDDIEAVLVAFAQLFHCHPLQAWRAKMRLDVGSDSLLIALPHGARVPRSFG